MTVLPVTKMLSLFFPSLNKFAALAWVGAKCKFEIIPVTCLLNSSGKGAYKLFVLRPASTCPTFIPR